MADFRRQTPAGELQISVAEITEAADPLGPRLETPLVFSIARFPLRSGNRRFRSGNRKFESISLQQTVCLSSAAAFEGREPGFRRGFARMAWRPRRQRRRDVLISLRRAARLCRAEFQYRSEADVVATVPGRSGRNQDLSGLSLGKSLKFGSGLSKAEHGPLIVPGKRQT